MEPERVQEAPGETHELPPELAALKREEHPAAFQWVKAGTAVELSAPNADVEDGVFAMPNGLYTLPVVPFDGGKVAVRSRVGITSMLEMVDEREWATVLIATRIRPEYPKDEKLLVEKIEPNARTYSSSPAVSYRWANLGGRIVLELTNTSPGYFGASSITDMLFGYGTATAAHATCRIDRHFVEQDHYFQLVTVALRVKPENAACEAALELSDWTLANLKTARAKPLEAPPRAPRGPSAGGAASPKKAALVPLREVPNSPPWSPAQPGSYSVQVSNDTADPVPEVLVLGNDLPPGPFGHLRPHDPGGHVHQMGPFPSTPHIVWSRAGESHQAAVPLANSVPKGKQVDEIQFVIDARDQVTVRLTLTNGSVVIPSETVEERKSRLLAEELSEAIRAGNNNKALRLLRKGSAAASRGLGAPHPVLLATRFERAKVLEALLEAGGDPNDADDYGASALAAAVERENLALVDLLLGAGADVNGGSSSPLRTAAEKGNLQLVQHLLERGADPNVEAGGQTPMVAAIRSKNIEVARALLAAGADGKARFVGGTLVEFGRRMNVSEEFLVLLRDAAGN